MSSQSPPTNGSGVFVTVAGGAGVFVAVGGGAGVFVAVGGGSGVLEGLGGCGVLVGGVVPPQARIGRMKTSAMPIMISFFTMYLLFDVVAQFARIPCVSVISPSFECLTAAARLDGKNIIQRKNCLFPFLRAISRVEGVSESTH